VIDLPELVQGGLMLAVWVALPLAAAALAGGVIAGLLGQWTGIQDASLGLVARAAFAIVALFVVAMVSGARVREFTKDAWNSLGNVEAPSSRQP
jgi:type III secretory pathway component EscS